MNTHKPKDTKNKTTKDIRSWLAAGGCICLIILCITLAARDSAKEKEALNAKQVGIPAPVLHSLWPNLSMADTSVPEETPEETADPLEEFIDLAIAYALNEPQFPVENGQTIYAEPFGDPWAEWCAEFIVWSLKQAEDELQTEYFGTVYPYTDNALTALVWFEEQNRYAPTDIYTPHKGDVVFFNHNDPTILTDHIAFVMDVIDANDQLFIITIEGNIPTDTIKQIRSRTLAVDSEIIIGYGSATQIMLAE